MKQQLRVGIDGFALGLEQGTGITSYTRNLSFALRDLGATIDVLYGRRIATRGNRTMREIQFFDVAPESFGAWRRRAHAVATAGTALSTLIRNRARATQVPIHDVVDRKPIASRLPVFDRILNAPDLFLRAGHQFRLTRRLLRVDVPDPPEIFHWTFPLPLYVAGSRNVYTILDLIPLRAPYATLDDKRQYLRLMKAVCRKADLIVTISENSKRDIEEILSPLSCPVVNTFTDARVPQRVQDMPAAELTQALHAIFNLRPHDYYLYVGAVEPRKNLPRVIEAFLRSGSRRRLVLAGPDGWRVEKELAMVQLPHLTGQRWDGDLLQRTDKILRFAYLGRRQLMLLIRGARAMVFPSLYEGFGLPVLESLIVGTPVITSATTSLGEIGGDAVLRVNPLEVDSITAAIRRVDADDFDFATAGVALRREAEPFSHERYCERIAAAYATIVPSFARASAAKA